LAPSLVAAASKKSRSRAQRSSRMSSMLKPISVGFLLLCVQLLARPARPRHSSTPSARKVVSFMLAPSLALFEDFMSTQPFGHLDVTDNGTPLPIVGAGASRQQPRR